MATMKKVAKKQARIGLRNVTVQITEKQYAELEASAVASGRRYIANEIRFRLFPPQAAK